MHMQRLLTLEWRWLGGFIPGRGTAMPSAPKDRPKCSRRTGVRSVGKISHQVSQGKGTREWEWRSTCRVTRRRA